MSYKHWTSIPLACFLLAACSATPKSASSDEMTPLKMQIVSSDADIHWRIEPRFGLVVRAYNLDGKNTELLWPMPQNEPAKVDRVMKCLKEVVTKQRFTQEKDFSNASLPRQEVDRCTQAEGLTPAITRTLPDSDRYELLISYPASLKTGTPSGGGAPLDSWSSGNDVLKAHRSLSKPGLDSDTVKRDVEHCRDDAARGGIARKIEVRGTERWSGSVSIGPFVERVDACLKQAGYTVADE